MLCSLALVLIAISVALVLYALWQAEQRKKLAQALTALNSGNFGLDRPYAQTCCSRQSRRFAESSIFQIFFFKHSSSTEDADSVALSETTPTFQAFTDRFKSFKDVAAAMRKAGLESCELILGVDFTASNEWQGRRTFNRQCLHALLIRGMNPYQQAISILGATLEPFSESGLIRAYGFGDQRTRNYGVFPFTPDGSPCSGFREVLNRYNRIAKNTVLAGPTSFAPILHASIDLARKSHNRFFVLIIISDGQMHPEERDTISALIEASKFPLSVIMVGVGDGPWDTMEEFDDMLPRRRFDNFQFVDFNKAVANKRNAEAVFALHALMEVPDQYKAIRQLGLI